MVEAVIANSFAKTTNIVHQWCLNITQFIESCMSTKSKNVLCLNFSITNYPCYMHTLSGINWLRNAVEHYITYYLKGNGMSWR